MPDVVWPKEGGCRRGRIRFRVSGPPLMELACHCRRCQRMSASAFSTTVMVATADFTLLAGETEIGGMHGKDVHHHHCNWCKSWIFTEGEDFPQSRNVRATLFDDPYWFAPWAETQTDEKLPWAETGANRSFSRFPAPEEFESLADNYRLARPWSPTS
jgi:hypothetical protein